MGEGEAFELGEAEDIKLSEDITLGAITFRRAPTKASCSSAIWAMACWV